jgi:DNA-binding NtrC family response regulator
MSPSLVEPIALLGTSVTAGSARAACAAAAAATGPVLIVAEPGLRPELVARELHDRARSGHPFVVVDCSGPEDRVEEELFGRVARTNGQAELVRVGAGAALLRAGGGSLYLPHVSDLSHAAQGRLSRALRDHEVICAGRHVRVTARVLAEIAPRPGGEDADGELRPDLLRRLARLRIEVPSLRERPDDIPLVAQALAAQLAGGRRPVFTQAALTVLAALAWPGNVDELAGVLERVLRRTGGNAIRQEDVLASLPIDGTFTRIPPEVSLREARRRFERDYIASVLERHRWRMSDAARTLGIERANLYRKTRQLGIVRRPPRSSLAS